MSEQQLRALLLAIFTVGDRIQSTLSLLAQGLQPPLGETGPEEILKDVDRMIDKAAEGF